MQQTAKNSKLHAIFKNDVLQPVAEGHSNRSEELCGFMALEGSRYRAGRKLMVVGRAVNSWGKGYTPKQLTSSNRQDELIEQLFYDNGKCQMAWVNEEAGTDDRYNTNRSAFWQAIRDISKKLGVWPEDEEDRWASRLVWSNLYKIALSAGGNPSNKLCNLQESGCIGLLREEVRVYEPDLVLFLTGMTWAWPFMQGLGCRLRAIPGLAEAFGEIHLGKSASPVPFVVAHHPQGKTRETLVADVTKALGDLQLRSST
ncbi:hypothetical protein [Halomonas denitrificans]|nr:hypothetical protein [Halomonas denitrificans]